MKKKTTKQPSNKPKPKLSTHNAEEIVALLNANHGKAFSFKQLCTIFHVKDRSSQLSFELLLEGLFERQMIGRNQKLYHSLRKPEHRVGKVDFVNTNFAYVSIEGMEEDVWVDARKLGNAFDGDTVAVNIFPNPRRSRMEGEVTELVERARTEFIGTVEMDNRYAFVVVGGKKMHYDFYIARHDLNGAKHQDKVIVELVSFGAKDKNPTGRIKKILGKAGENEAEIHSIMFEYRLPFEFPEKIEHEAAQIPTVITKEEIKKRRDFRNITTFTVDPVNAKDFDDALSIRQTEEGLWEIGVHIADVTHYVRPGTALETEALDRATSVYLVDRTVPMLPEKLSNELCSLRPHEDKLTFSAVFLLDNQANIKGEWFGRTVIHSQRRFTYEEAQERIDSQEGDFAKELTELNRLALLLRKDRFAKGAIGFESVEFVFRLDENGKPLGLFPKERKEAHKMIEEFMLLANKQVAEFIYRKKKNNEPPTMVYRVHESPDPERVQLLANFVRRFGFSIEVEEDKLAWSLNQLSAKVDGTPHQNVIESQAIRTMAKARYTTEALGHYGLAFRHYSHFTSPIRRYPDMMAHRLLQHYLDGGQSLPRQEYELKCKHSSDRERRAAEAERASIKYKQVEFMQSYLGKRMKGFISGITEWGLYVELEQTKCEGMVRLASMRRDDFYYDEKNLRVVGRNTGLTYSFGDAVEVIVRSANLDKRTLDFDMYWA